jgi:hypothetical protein
MPHQWAVAVPSKEGIERLSVPLLGHARSGSLNLPNYFPSASPYLITSATWSFLDRSGANFREMVNGIPPPPGLFNDEHPKA